jgi:hypothetical protein
MEQLRNRMVVRGDMYCVTPPPLKPLLNPAYVENLMTYTVYAEFELNNSIDDLVWKKEGKMV